MIHLPFGKGCRSILFQTGAKQYNHAKDAIMKAIALFVLLSTSISVHAQIIKKIGSDIKNEAEWKLRSKIRQKTSDALDTALAQPKKIKGKKKNGKKGQTSQDAKQTASIKTSSQKESEEMSMGEGFIKLSLSATEVFRGGTVIVTGTSIKYGSLNKVKLIVTGNGETEEEDLKLYENGSFVAGWDAEEAGEFTLTVKSSDGKDQQSAKVKVYDIDVMDDLWVQDNIEITHKIYDKLKEQVKTVEASLGEKDKIDLEKKMDAVKDKVDAVLKLFDDLNKAAAGLGSITKKGASLPPNFAGNLSQLNDKLHEQYNQMKQVADAADHKAYDNTICEYFVMLNEACAAFSTFTNVWSKSVTTILKNIVMDKALPKGVEIVNAKKGPLPSDYDVMAKQPAKLFATAQLDAEGLFGKLSMASFTGDITQFVSDFLLKKYCGVFKGELNQDYQITYRNKVGATWWSYSYNTEAAVSFRYPKKNAGKIIKMKGNIEGNATSFKFFQDVEQMDDFKEQMKGRARLTPIALIKPLAVPFATSQKDELGFGAIARGLATPSYFNIPVDVEYDTDAETIKIFLNDPIIDFTPMVKYTYGFIGVAAGIPLVTRVDFPINKAKLTLNAVISQNNELKVTKDAKNNLTVKGSGQRQIGSGTSDIEHKISFSLTAKNDN